jgi:TldD protein
MDDPSMSRSGFYNYDDEGVEGRSTVLIEDGMLKAKLSDLSNAFSKNIQPTGNGRAINYKSPPIARMSNIFVKESDDKYEDMLESTKEGLFLYGLGGGQLLDDIVYYNVNGGRIIRDGRLCEYIGNITLEIPVVHFLKNIEMIGDKLHNGHASFCVKNNQAYMPVWNGAPYMKINNIKAYQNLLKLTV